MPNQRDPSKRLMAAWVQHEELDRYKRVAKSLGMSLTEYIVHALQKAEEGVPPKVRGKSGAARKRAAGSS